MPAADDQQPLGHVGELERAGGVDQPRVVVRAGPGGCAALEPAAMMQCSKPIVVAPSAPSTVRTFGEANAPTPCTTSTLRCLARPTRPPVSCATTDSFHPRSPSRSISGSPKRDAVRRGLLGLARSPWRCAAAPWTGCSRRSGRPRRARVALDEHDLQAEVGGAERGGVAARAGAEHDHVGARCRPRPRTPRRRRGGGRRGGRGRGASGAGAARRRRSRGLEREDRACPPRPCRRPPPPAPRRCPAAGDGTSIVALSDSSVISGSSAATPRRPGETSTSMIGTSEKSPMSGTRTSIVSYAPARAVGRLLASWRPAPRHASSAVAPLLGAAPSPAAPRPRA